ncbi:MAG TPA: hypothetical protein PLC05_00360 [bacterium]|nr:hypothetical protein [bacterium]HOR57059.1 hypothetical protein [bacterium]HPL55946.1 hypothetical protein [bacterium]
MKIIPTILAYTEDEFAQQLNLISDLSAELQIDIVSNGFGTPTVNLNKVDLPYEKDIILHIMTKNNDEIMYYENFSHRRIILQAEVGDKLNEIIDDNKEKWGLAMSPETPVESVLPYINKVSELLILTVEPGRQGRQFQENNLFKIDDVRRINYHITVSVDGGVNEKNIAKVARAGADVAYIGSALTTSKNPRQTYDNLCKAI